jgi:hypothetical protein
LYRFEKIRANDNAWVDEVKHDLCHVLYHRKQLVVIFEFDSPRHNGNLEDAILEALLNGRYFSLARFRIRIYYLFSGEIFGR